MQMTQPFATLLFLVATSAFANENIADQYPDSLLYAKPVEFIPGVWSATGATAPPTYENAGHNNNLSFIVTGDGVVVINAGASWGLAKALHTEIKAITEQPVKLVIDENGQGHAMLGNGYWVELGVPVLAHTAAAETFAAEGAASFDAGAQLLADRFDDTRVQAPTETFDDVYTVPFGDFTIEARYLGPAHSPGDIVIWLPDQKLVISGDMAFHERMLPIFPDTDTKGWVETWETAFEPLGATYVIPGHGHPTNVDQVRLYTHDYLVYLRRQIETLLDEGGGLAEAYYIDQTPYAHLDTFEELATKNAGRVFEQMEFE
ncbi:Glyoxylase, beta-lactamase superfamily II [Loktanella salsilacus]|jgi:glyoxylase-like metal-dependent hydrolase (beta-lactamase superfamily II)|uniref:Glyoxylase, beta-lactamase superfamily II n=2 Tax=Loktanella salsilacus TaxID=195913 RepID=A0A1I4ITJ8_9RHOB|nr:MBL fold metallo-hydrolase [Loktanella salsilacus]SFL57699.1 Glyoxylase, beta-lactamase superfamily II [Loktanella salsilacus]